MPAERLSMRRIRELLRLHFGAAASDRAIARELGVARSTVQDYLARAAAAGLGWPLPAERDRRGARAAAVRQRRRPGRGFAGTPNRTGRPWSRELKRPGVNLTGAVGGISGRSSRRLRLLAVFASCTASSSSGCRRRCGRHHVAGDKGSSTTPARRSRSSIRRPARCARPRSSSPCSAPRTTPTPRRPGRRGCPTGSARTCAHVPVLTGRAALVVPDNLKCGVHKASFYDPEINRSYGTMAAHYGVGVLPATADQSARQGEGRSRQCASPRATSSAGCAIRRSSRSPNATPRSPTCSSG